jgi:DNA-binding NtrC family response regulator
MGEPSIRILVLDDEMLVTDSLALLLRSETSWEIHTHTRPRGALAALEVADFHAVVADFLMPEMDGLAFLAAVRTRRPLASRLLLTGYADKSNAIRSINEVGLYQYIEKPWDNDALLLVLHNAVERSTLLRELDETMRRLDRSDGALAALRTRLLRELL